MNIEEIVDAIDAEIRRLQQARALLCGMATAPRAEGGSSVGNGKRVMSAEGRARVAAAQRARWAKVKRVGK
jgi:hypothetical protein